MFCVTVAESLLLSYESVRGSAPRRVWEWPLLWISTKALVHPWFVLGTDEVYNEGSSEINEA